MLITFSTAWSPPKPIILAASKMFSTLVLDLRYFEAGCCFNGIYECKNGEILEEDCAKSRWMTANLNAGPLDPASRHHPTGDRVWIMESWDLGAEGFCVFFRFVVFPLYPLWLDRCERVRPPLVVI